MHKLLEKLNSFVRGHCLGPTAGIQIKDILTQVSYDISKISEEYRLAV